jgi:RNA polymerase sigma-70 factor (ECF subfamily)
LYRLAGTVADAEDLTQQTFLLVQRNLGQLREVDRLRHWVFRIARNQYLQSRRKRVPLPASTADLVVDQLPAEEQDHSPIDSEHLQIVLGELSEEHRLILMMYYFEDLAYREIADQLQIPIGTVMSRLARAKDSLRLRLRHGQKPKADEIESPSQARATEPGNRAKPQGISHG